MNIVFWITQSEIMLKIIPKQQFGSKRMCDLHIRMEVGEDVAAVQGRNTDGLTV